MSQEGTTCGQGGKVLKPGGARAGTRCNHTHIHTHTSTQAVTIFNRLGFKPAIGAFNGHFGEEKGTPGVPD